LVESKPDQQSKRLLVQESVRFLVTGERQRCRLGHRSMVARGPGPRARPCLAQVIRRWRPLANATIPAPTTSRPAATNIALAWLSTAIAASASESGAATTDPSIRKLIVR